MWKNWSTSCFRALIHHQEWNCFTVNMQWHRNGSISRSFILFEQLSIGILTTHFNIIYQASLQQKSASAPVFYPRGILMTWLLTSKSKMMACIGSILKATNIQEKHFHESHIQSNSYNAITNFAFRLFSARFIQKWNALSTATLWQATQVRLYTLICPRHLMKCHMFLMWN